MARSSSKSLYTVLGLTKESNPTTADITRAYRRLALQYHPDRNPDGAEQFKVINDAYAILSDEDRRAVYDVTGVVPGEASGVDPASPEAQAQRSAELAGEVAAFYATYRGSPEEAEDAIACYLRCDGDFKRMIRAELLFDNGKASEVQRLRELIRKSIASGKLSSSQTWQNTSSDRAVRKLEAHLARERREAEEALNEFNDSNNKNNNNNDTSANDAGDLGALRALIQNRQKQQWEDMVLSMESKYLHKKKGSKQQQKSRKDEANDSDNVDERSGTTKTRKRAVELASKDNSTTRPAKKPRK